METATQEKIIPQRPYEFMFNRIVDYIIANMEMEGTQAALMLMDFEKIHGEDAVVSMYGFLRYVATSSDPRTKNEGSIKSTIGHDLYGRKDAFMLPRTSSYYKFCNH